MLLSALLKLTGVESWVSHLNDMMYSRRIHLCSPYPHAFLKHEGLCLGLLWQLSRGLHGAMSSVLSVRLLKKTYNPTRHALRYDKTITYVVLSSQIIKRALCNLITCTES